ncbi:MAG TPA: hypothetical protein VFG42_07900 [Baekduia sp.]|uniref:hypothetical protein n=1 Tax=Baekduia sp. TaxID=2600305 RepID=UPI002D79F46A|nr:hypothetical protein [Baekduia sp.]HET6506697.1 hypothetical protein [Baekduia sp.]
MTRPAAYLTALLALFGLAYLAGGARVGVGEGARATAERGHGGADGAMAMGDAHDDASVPGLAVAERGLRLVAPATLRAGVREDVAFRIADDRGATVRDFDVEHTKKLHLIAVRRDLTGFQHLHPTQAADGSWRVPLTLRDPGAYRLLADFTPRGGQATTLGSDVLVGGDFAPRALPAPSAHASVDGYDVALAPSTGREATLRFAISRDGAAVTPEPYLGAAGHLVALREGDLAYLHVHPDANGKVAFGARFPSAGRYRLFLQFQHEGRVHTAAFTKVVS